MCSLDHCDLNRSGYAHCKAIVILRDDVPEPREIDFSVIHRLLQRELDGKLGSARPYVRQMLRKQLVDPLPDLQIRFVVDGQDFLRDIVDALMLRRAPLVGLERLIFLRLFEKLSCQKRHARVFRRRSLRASGDACSASSIKFFRWFQVYGAAREKLCWSARPMVFKWQLHHVGDVASQFRTIPLDVTRELAPEAEIEPRRTKPADSPDPCTDCA